MRGCSGGRRSVLAMIAGLVVLGGCTSGPAEPRSQLRGASVEVVGSWTGVEQQRFTAVLRHFAAATGARVHYTGVAGYLAEAIDTRLARRRPPDVALLPQPGLLRRYALAGALVPLDATARRLVREHYGPVWRDLASVQGRPYGVWFKAANKSLVWYDVATFERAGVVPPDDLAGLQRVAALLAAQGVTPFAVGAGEGWTLTDWFENLYLRLAGPARYDALAAHRLPWTDPSVGSALALMGRLLRSGYLLGGAPGALHTGFEQSVARAFGPPARAAMLAEGDFVAGFVRPSSRLGTGVDAFLFPGTYRGLPVVVGGGDVAVQMTRSRAATELLRYLASPAAAAVWAAAGGFLSPNLDLDLSVYPDALSRTAARNLVEAGDGFRFDLSDLQPAEFGAAPTSGMQGDLRRFLTTGDVAATQQRLETDASAMIGGRAR
jgi:alpha-glucoside transport system substrate-binding protein